ncbi:acetate--CoA ligase family protein [Desulfatiglans anilini]|uniref:acetate--CoA ligase family protein n=1 Tax=Desulfatiglans anilini TaxID=90728 RepID=UPI000404CBD8|nr:acetate--CoA ligase family protein [Desulfatiglans anilini]
MNLITEALERGESTLSEHASKQLLAAYGIPVTREVEVLRPEDLAGALDEVGFPMVLKACGARFTHKTERGLVRVDLRTREEALRAFEAIWPEAEQAAGSVLVQEMVGGRRELVAGLTRDPQFGPCVMFGLGGIFTEILRDVVFRVAPVTERDAQDMFSEIKGRRILDAVRGMPPADRDHLARILIALGRIGLEHPRVKEIDVNPLILDAERPVAVDALVVLGD